MSDFGYFFWIFSLGAIAWFFFILPYFRRVEKKRLKLEKEIAARMERLRILAEQMRQHEQRAKQQRSNSSSSSSAGPGTVASIITDSFKLLGLSVKATEDEIKKAYRSLTLKHHPDRGGNAEKFIQITKAKNNCLKYIGKTNVVALFIVGLFMFSCAKKDEGTKVTLTRDTVAKPTPPPVDNTRHYKYIVLAYV